MKNQNGGFLGAAIEQLAKPLIGNLVSSLLGGLTGSNKAPAPQQPAPQQPQYYRQMPPPVYYPPMPPQPPPVPMPRNSYYNNQVQTRRRNGASY